MKQEEATKKPSKFKKILKYTYLSTLHILAVVSIFLMFTALAVKFKWTNQSGNIDVNNRYFAQIANKYGKDLKLDSVDIMKEQSLLIQKIAVLAKYQPYNAQSILKAFTASENTEVANRMLDAVGLLLKNNKTYMEELQKITEFPDTNRLSIFEFSNYKVWRDFCKVVKKDQKAIDSASRITGVESRLIVMCLVGEQVRMFNSGRERFKQYVMPFSHIMMPTNRGYGVTGILEHTAYQIERNLTNKNSPFYPGEYFYKCLNYKQGYPHVIRGGIGAHRSKTIQRLIAGGDHFYSYLYTAFLLRQYQSHWEKNNFDLSKRPEILGTLFNIGYHKSKPKAAPEAGGSSFKVGGKVYTFGGLCFEFYYSGELLDLFPITKRAFTPVKELEETNKEYVEHIQELINGKDSTDLSLEENQEVKIENKKKKKS